MELNLRLIADKKLPVVRPGLLCPNELRLLNIPLDVVLPFSVFVLHNLSSACVPFERGQNTLKLGIIVMPIHDAVRCLMSAS